MTQMEYEKLDYYGKLKLLLAISGQVRNGLKSVGDKYAARDYIARLCDTLETHFQLLANDPEINETEFFKRNFASIFELIPLVKKDEADYSFLIRILEIVESEAEAKLPAKLQLARLFDNLLTHKAEISETCGIEEETFLDIIGSMRNKSDAISNILKSPSQKTK